MIPIIAGIDEAGKGAVLGPLVISGVSVEENKLKKLKELKVRDSKEISHKRRIFLSDEIEKIAKDIIVVKVGACKIDNYKKMGINLNRLETMKFADIINYLGSHKTYIDAYEANTKKLKTVLERMTKNGSELIVENYADKNHLIVGAASIIAKVEREKEIEKLRKKHKFDGSGYPSDERTVQWLKTVLEKKSEFPDCVRRTWATSEILDGQHKQKTIFSWFRK